MERRVETDRAGPFRFELGVDPSDPDVRLAIVRVDDAHARLLASPLSQVVNELEREVLVESIHGTNTIEGAELSEEETSAILDRPPESLRADRELRVRNIKSAYDLALRDSPQPDWQPDVEFVRAIHREICRDLAHPDNRPGLIRDNPRERVTHVGDEGHGGRYKPPQYGADIKRLLSALLEWQSKLRESGVPALIRAPLAHYYFEIIHPFWDGNGRVGRVLEAAILRNAGYRYAPFALSRFYLERIDRYFTLFNTCRKAADNNRPTPNLPFVQFHLDGMLEVVNRLHERVNQMVKMLLYGAAVAQAVEQGQINARQHALVRLVRDQGRPFPLDEARKHPGYVAMYRGLTDKTQRRDLQKLRELRLLRLDSDQRLWPGIVGTDDRGSD